MFAYGNAVDNVDKYVRIGESTALKSLRRFIKKIVATFGDEYLRSPNSNGIARLLAIREHHDFPGMLGALTACIGDGKIFHMRGKVPDDELVQIIMNNLGPMYEMVVSAAQYAPVVAAFAANRGHGGGRSRGTGHDGVPSNRGTIPNSQGGTARGSFTN
ncbi:hypothetical protein L3X38_032510 [Prunus dulcis]|uniref:Uncharacterized protein n=1 Tax=Prunus dulcis TaxID=3755 RepID=A0AAD4YWP4_PRUDU|nr:hypothetical protein L3X38_032510 [Prunus dulcis]